VKPCRLCKKPKPPEDYIGTRGEVETCLECRERQTKHHKPLTVEKLLELRRKVKLPPVLPDEISPGVKR